MSKGKNITPNQRAMIKVLLDQNFSQGPFHIVEAIMDSTSYY
uniref:Repressor LexA n=1 Tax=Heterorhabditis bacteriophora TaxID=37862 RepID=A0A1I7WK06_HETBA